MTPDEQQQIDTANARADTAERTGAINNALANHTWADIDDAREALQAQATKNTDGTWNFGTTEKPATAIEAAAALATKKPHWLKPIVEKQGTAAAGQTTPAVIVNTTYLDLLKDENQLREWLKTKPAEVEKLRTAHFQMN